MHAAAEIVTYMKSFDDPRLSKYFNPVVRTASTTAARRRLLLQPVEGLLFASETNALDRLMWMNAAEVAFLKAEMAVNGWDVTGAATLYEEGIRLFEQYQAENYRPTRHGRADRLFRSAQANNYTRARLQRHRRWDGALSGKSARSSPRNGSPSSAGTEAWPSSAARDIRGSTPRPPAPTPERV
ncbi:MAG: SusD/RagB family nutrient-binding outer membrane lipoprotein [Alistipes finegoldii]